VVTDEGGRALKRYPKGDIMKIKPNTIYDIEFRCTTPGPDVEEGSFRGYWTGEIDTWGKKIFRPIDGRGPFYLFDKEIVYVEGV